MQILLHTEINTRNQQFWQFPSITDLERCHNDSKNVKTYDFKTLYTNIPQDKLKDNINAFISSIFKLRKKKYINWSY